MITTLSSETNDFLLNSRIREQYSKVTMTKEVNILKVQTQNFTSSVLRILATYNMEFLRHYLSSES